MLFVFLGLMALGGTIAALESMAVRSEPPARPFGGVDGVAFPDGAVELTAVRRYQRALVDRESLLETAIAELRERGASEDGRTPAARWIRRAVFPVGIIIVLWVAVSALPSLLRGFMDPRAGSGHDVSLLEPQVWIPLVVVLATTLVASIADACTPQSYKDGLALRRCGMRLAAVRRERERIQEYLEAAAGKAPRAAGS